MADNPGKAALAEDADKRKERLKKVGARIYKDGRTFLAAAGLGYLSQKGITGLDHGSEANALRIAAEVPLYTAVIGASLTQVMSGLREVGDLIEGASSSVGFLRAKQRLSSLDESAGQRLRNSGLSGLPALSEIDVAELPQDPLDRWIALRQQAIERGLDPAEAVREANLKVYGDEHGPQAKRDAAQPEPSLG